MLFGVYVAVGFCAERGRTAICMRCDVRWREAVVVAMEAFQHLKRSTGFKASRVPGEHSCE